VTDFGGVADFVDETVDVPLDTAVDMVVEAAVDVTVTFLGSLGSSRCLYPFAPSHILLLNAYISLVSALEQPFGTQSVIADWNSIVPQ
jgi:hypothetical protein